MTCSSVLTSKGTSVYVGVGGEREVLHEGQATYSPLQAM